MHTGKKKRDMENGMGNGMENGDSACGKYSVNVPQHDRDFKMLNCRATYVAL